MDALRAAGVKAWAAVGLLLVGAAAAFLIILLKPLVIALLAALCVSLALSPAVDTLGRHGIRRGLGATLGILLLIVVGIGVLVMVVKGLVSQWSGISSALDTAVRKLREASSGAEGSRAGSVGTRSASTLLYGAGPSWGDLIGTTASLLVGVFVFLFATFFMLRDGPSMARAAAPWTPFGQSWMEHVGKIIRGYVVGLTLLGIFNAAVVGLGALILGLPLIGTLVVITLLGNYVPYLGAWVAGAYAVLIALGAGGVREALIMIVVVFLANGMLQTMLQPFAYGTVLHVHPLAILLATVVGSLLAGIAGVMVAAPAVAIIQYTARLLRERRAGDQEPGDLRGDA